jgi:hypothetical protein
MLVSHTEKYGVIRKSFVFISSIIIMIRQIEELTSKKLVMGIIVALTSVSATSLLVPTYATTTSDDVSDTTTGLADIVNGTTMIPSEEDIRNLVSGAITDALQNIQIVQVFSGATTIPPGGIGTADAVCPDETLNVVGGGFSTLPLENVRVYDNFPSNVFTWRVSGVNENPTEGEDVSLVATALCLVVSE